MAFDFWNTALGRLLRGLPATPPALWMPTYQPAVNLWVSEPNNSGGVARQPLNQQDFVTSETAYYLANVYGAFVTSQAPLGPGPDSTPAGLVEYWLDWTASGVPYKLNAGALAVYYCPAGGTPPPAAVDNPDVAVANCRSAIAAARSDALGLVR